MKKLLTILCLVLISTSFVFAQGGNEKTTVAQKSNEPVTIDLCMVPRLPKPVLFHQIG